MSGLSLKAKLICAFAVQITIPLVMGAVTYTYFQRVTQAYNFVATVTLPNIVDIAHLRGLVKEAAIAAATSTGFSASQADVDASRLRVSDLRAEADGAIKSYGARPYVKGEEALWNTLKVDIVADIEAARHLVEMSAANTPASNLERDRYAANEYRASRTKCRNGLDQFTHMQVDSSQTGTARAIAAAATLTSALLAVVAIGTCMGLAIAYWTIINLIRALRQITGELNNGATEVAAAVNRLSEASEQLSSAATEQASSVQETSASVEEINAMVAKSTDSAKESEQLSEQSRKEAERGKLVVQEMVGAMDDISKNNQTIVDEINKNNERISDIVKVIQEIGSKTRVINDIVFQTKLLSFNASVEAARAGEHGKGFAVVAEEVGNLAQMSGNASKEISQMLDESNQRVEKTVGETKKMVERLMANAKVTVDRGGTVARQCGEVLEAIVKNVVLVSEAVQSISQSSTEQSHGVNEITTAIHQLNQVSQSNSSAASQTASATDKLSVQATSLRTAAGDLSALIDGGQGYGPRLRLAAATPSSN
jgi:methyl-accepting chemotaxis protein